jgi:molybdopterin molybdotransferase
MTADAVALATAWAWIEANAPRLGAEEVDLETAHGRVPAAPLHAASDVPATACAVEDGYAVRAEETLGAATYNPLSFPVVEVDDRALPRGTIARIGAGQPLPAGADAVLASAFVEPEADGRISVLAAVAEGDGVAMAASELRAGDRLWVEGRRGLLRPAEIALLSAAGMRRVPVVRRPRTQILTAGTADARDVLGPMLHALVERDGGTVVGLQRHEHGEVRSAELATGADVVVMVGAIGGDLEIAIRGVAIEPGRETCLARLDDTIIALLPSLPAACFWSYELVAGRAIRCKGGRDPGFPFVLRRFRTTRKIASDLGVTEVVPVRIDAADPGAVVPCPNGPAPRLRNAASADGFALIPATSEGSPAGSELDVWLWGPMPERIPDLVEPGAGPGR